MLRIAQTLKRKDDGNVLIIVIFVSFIVAALATLTLVTGRASDWSSAKDRNSSIALGVTESAIQEGIAEIESKVQSGSFVTSFSIPEGTTPQGTYHATVTRSGKSFIIEAWGRTGGTNLGRSRHVKVTLQPPKLFPDGKYALFSFTSIDLNNNDKIYAGDVWANDSIAATNGVIVQGSITSAQSWIDFAGDEVTGNVWSGGRNTSGAGFGIKTTGKIGGWAKASISSPCPGTEPTQYNAILGEVTGSATAVGAVSGGPVHGNSSSNACTTLPADALAAPAKGLPPFNFNKNNYDDPSNPNDYFEFTPAQYSDPIQSFNDFVATNGGVHQGVYYVQADSVSQSHQLDLSPLKISGDTMIVTNAPVFANQGPNDAALPAGQEATFALVSHYTPPSSTSCDYNHDDSECAIHFKNGFDQSCKTATLLYADNGPIGIKNNSNNPNDPDNMCGAVVGEAIIMKNNEKVTYDPRIERLLGFQNPTYEVARWEELPAS